MKPNIWFKPNSLPKNSVRLFCNEKYTVYKCCSENASLVDYWGVFNYLGERLTTLYSAELVEEFK